MVATFHTPSGWVLRATFRDDELPHQLQFRTDSWHIYATCNCGAEHEVIEAVEAIAWHKAHLRGLDT